MARNIRTPLKKLRKKSRQSAVFCKQMCSILFKTNKIVITPYKVMDNTRNICRVCMNSNICDNIVDSSCNVEFFRQITGLKVLTEKLWLCLWCNSVFKRTIEFIKLALEAESFFTLHYEPLQNNIKGDKRKLFNLCLHNNLSINIPDVRDNEVNVPEASNIPTSVNECNEDNLKVLEHFEDDHFKSSELENVDIKLERVKVIGLMKLKKDFNYNGLKFEMVHLNIEEQMNEVDLKKKKNCMKFVCIECGNGFLTEDLYSEHKIRHTESAGPHMCSVCGLRFKSRAVLSQHQLLHRRKFRCIICGSFFNRWSHCLVHRHKCGNVSCPTTCGVCLKIFSNEHSLSVHMKRVHETEKKYECERCQRKFASKQRLTVHLRSHTGSRPFSCSKCERTFTTHSNMKAHETVHSDETPHYCVECDVAYKTVKSLKRHFMQSPRHAGSREK